MKLYLKICFPLSIFWLGACGRKPTCDRLPSSFDSYDDAISAVEGAKFNVNEDLNTDKSGFVEDAHFYSCDNEDGYLILELKGKKYIYANVPSSVWNQFKNASSFGSFYDENIKNNYKLELK